MKHPPYHLRINKAVDRYILIELLRHLQKCTGYKKYKYYGFGGPFLEDCRLIHELCPEIEEIVSYEINAETHKRQLYHKFSQILKLHKDNFNIFLSEYSSKGNELFWLDYTNLKYNNFEQFMELLLKADNNVIVRLTLPARSGWNRISLKQHYVDDEIDKKFDEFLKKFSDKFSAIIPSPINEDDFIPGDYPILVQKMVRLASEKILPEQSGNIFQPLSSHYYNDGTFMLSVTGIVCKIDEVKKIREHFKKWKYANLDWSPPEQIDLPILTLKERLKLEPLLPLKNNSGKILAKELGYIIDYSEEKTIKQLSQYAEFYRYYPYFVKAII